MSRPQLSTHRRAGSNWREFEELVSRIERMLAPKGAIVRSPDRVQDLVTGRWREVDGSIRSKIGSANVLVTLECRRRGRRSDDTWIEQLAKKREKIGAAKTIAVSSSAFSDSAVKTANLNGIELRRFADISDEEISKNFLSSFGITLIQTRYKFEGSAFIGADGVQIHPDEFAPELLQALQSEEGAYAPLFQNRSGEWATLMTLALQAHTDNVPLNGEGIVQRVTWRPEPAQFTIATKTGSRVISEVILDVRLLRSEHPADLSLLQYSSAGTEIMDVAHGTADLGDKKLQMHAFLRRGRASSQSSPDSDLQPSENPRRGSEKRSRHRRRPRR